MGLNPTFPCRQWLLNQAYQTGFQSPANKEDFRQKPYTLAKTEIIYPKNVRAKVEMDFT